MTTADTKQATAFAHELAELLDDTKPARAQVESYYDPDGECPAVRVLIDRMRYELLMPAPGAIFALFRNGRWLGGMGLRLGQADPGQVADVLLWRISQSHGS
jgi:hypothetical protein